MRSKIIFKINGLRFPYFLTSARHKKQQPQNSNVRVLGLLHKMISETTSVLFTMELSEILRKRLRLREIRQAVACLSHSLKAYIRMR